MENKNNINLKFNFLLALFYIFVIVVDVLFSPIVDEKTPIGQLYEISFISGATITLLIVAVIIYFGTLVVKFFWNKFISDVFSIREITFQESLSICLIAGLFAI